MRNGALRQRLLLHRAARRSADRVRREIAAGRKPDLDRLAGVDCRTATDRDQRIGAAVAIRRARVRPSRSACAISPRRTRPRVDRRGRPSPCRESRCAPRCRRRSPARGCRRHGRRSRRAAPPRRGRTRCGRASRRSRPGSRIPSRELAAHHRIVGVAAGECRKAAEVRAQLVSHRRRHRGVVRLGRIERDLVAEHVIRGR